MYICQSQSPNSSPTPCHFPPLVSIRLFSTSVSLFDVNILVQVFFWGGHSHSCLECICRSDLAGSHGKCLINFFNFPTWIHHFTPHQRCMDNSGCSRSLTSQVQLFIDIYTLICIKWITNKNLLYK